MAIPDIAFEKVITAENNSFTVRFDSIPVEYCGQYHLHPEIELTYIQKGFGQRMISGVVEPFEAGDVVLVPSGAPHAWYYLENDFLIQEYCIQFNPDTILPLLSSCPEFIPSATLIKELTRPLHITGETAVKIARILPRMINQEAFPRLISLLEILNDISASPFCRVMPTNSITTKRNAIAWKVQEALDYIVKHLSESIYVGEVASHVGMSKNSFCNFIKSATGLTFTEALNELRITKAAILLANYPDKPISEIANAVGYTSISHFNHLFREKKSCSPNSYRNKGEQD